MPFRITHRQEKLLESFIRHDGYITSEYLAEELKVSPRTIRQDIKHLSIELLKNGITLIAVPSKGYLIPKEDIENALTYLQSLEIKHSDLPTMPLGRSTYIIRKLLFMEKTIFIHDLEEDLHISSSTVEKDIQEVRKWFEDQNLHLISSRSAGIYLEGSEISIRYAMINYFWSFHDVTTLLILDEVLNIFSANIVEPVKKIVYGLHDQEGIYLSDNDYLNIILYLSTTIKRITAGHEIPDNPPASIRLSENELDLALNIAHQITEEFSIQFSQSEIKHLGNYFKQTNIFARQDANKESSLERILSLDFATDALRKLSTQFKLDLSSDDNLINSLATYLDSLIKRRDNEAQVKKPALEGISKEYPVAFEMAVAISDIVQNEFNFSLNQHEIGSVALYICAAIERLLTRKKHTNKTIVVIICATGAGGSQLLAVKAKRHFPDMEVAGIYPSHRLDEAKSKDPDLIISTIPIHDPTYPVIQISHLLTKEDHSRVRKALDDLKAANSKPDLNQLFRADLFFADIDIADWQEALQFLCKEIQNLGYADETFSESVLKRESVFPTAIGNLVAIPHAFSPQKKQSWISVGILKKPVQWGDEMVQLILLLNIDHSSEDDYKTIFETLYEILSVKKYTKKLINCTDYESFTKEINE